MMYSQNVKELRKEKGWTQQQLAFRLGISVGCIQRIEQNLSYVKEPVIIKLVKLGMKV